MDSNVSYGKELIGKVQDAMDLAEFIECNSEGILNKNAHSWTGDLGDILGQIQAYYGVE